MRQQLLAAAVPGVHTITGACRRTRNTAICRGINPGVPIVPIVLIKNNKNREDINAGRGLAVVDAGNKGHMSAHR
jgi:hypothetical protein